MSWNGHAYDAATPMQQRTAKRDLKCCTCKQTIARGEPYVLWSGYRGFYEHVDICPERSQLHKQGDA